MKLRMFLAILCLIATLPYRATAQQDRSPDSTVSDFQKDFAAAYNRGDVDAMAGAFTESAIRVTRAAFSRAGPLSDEDSQMP
ncbi:hypothetical protein [Bradyrhizobium sp. MOS002]|uniref:hypothetical protein n=1 Tax=Bradyrhizobium sp. MOS002 TaxID=2133947 RepID=UPI000D12C705|nr:hypothetical protein [Bradyrhizobium sp. MOS002]PSO22713.1 hypothetical protein C7G41_33885 [Bradyrhizobium sp. MOS002]